MLENTTQRARPIQLRRATKTFNQWNTLSSAMSVLCNAQPKWDCWKDGWMEYMKTGFHYFVFVHLVTYCIVHARIVKKSAPFNSSQSVDLPKVSVKKQCGTQNIRKTAPFICHCNSMYCPFHKIAAAAPMQWSKQLYHHLLQMDIVKMMFCTKLKHCRSHPLFKCPQFASFAAQHLNQTSSTCGISTFNALHECNKSILYETESRAAAVMFVFRSKYQS